jgi:hypothetical protein
MHPDWVNLGRARPKALNRFSTQPRDNLNESKKHRTDALSEGAPAAEKKNLRFSAMTTHKPAKPAPVAKKKPAAAAAPPAPRAQTQAAARPPSNSAYSTLSQGYPWPPAPQ